MNLRFDIDDQIFKYKHSFEYEFWVANFILVKSIIFLYGFVDLNFGTCLIQLG